MDEAEPDVLAYMGFPASHRVKLHSTNPLDPSTSSATIKNRLGRGLLAPLRAGRHGPVPLYLRTDTHWTAQGCLLAYHEIMRALGAIPPADIGARPVAVSDELMDLGEKLDRRPRERLERFMLQRDAERVEVGPLLAAYEAAGRDREVHVGAHVVYRNAAPGADPRRLVLFGDSCAHYAPFMLTGLLAESFSEVHFVWSSSLDWDYIARVRPDILLFELAERFMAHVSNDQFDVSMSGQRGTPGRLGRIQEKGLSASDSIYRPDS